jgi:protein TonB
MVHIGVIAALCALLHARHPPTPPGEISVPVIFAPAPEPIERTPQILASSTLPEPISTEPASLAPLPSMTVPADRAGELPRLSPWKRPRDRSRTVSPAEPHDSTNQALSPPATAPAVATVQRVAATPSITASHNTQDALASWEARIRRAVQDAAIYPASARLLHRDGRAQVRFDYDRGTIEAASIAQSSHVDALDNAALAAVTRAAFPAPPPELGPQNLTMLVWVQFTLNTEE